MKIKTLLIAGAAVLGLTGIGGASVHAESAQQANQQAANRILSTEKQAYAKGEISKKDMDANVNNPELESEAHGGNSGSQSGVRTSAPSKSNASGNSESSNTNTHHTYNDQNNKTRNSKLKTVNSGKNARRSKNESKVANKHAKKGHRNPVTKRHTKSVKSSKSKPKSSRYYIGIGIIVVVAILTVIGACAKFSRRNK